MIEHLYKSEEYVDELDNLENLADTLLQLIMDDGTVVQLPIGEKKRSTDSSRPSPKRTCRYGCVGFPAGFPGEH